MAVSVLGVLKLSVLSSILPFNRYFMNRIWQFQFTSLSKFWLFKLFESLYEKSVETKMFQVGVTLPYYWTCDDSTTHLQRHNSCRFQSPSRFVNIKSPFLVTVVWIVQLKRLIRFFNIFYNRTVIWIVFIILFMSIPFVSLFARVYSDSQWRLDSL